MKKKIFIMVALLGYLFSSCTMYKPFMSEASKEPIAHKLPKMEFEWYTKGDVKGPMGMPGDSFSEFVKGMVRDEVSKNITAATGKKAGTIEVNCEKLHVKQNIGYAWLAGFTYFMAPLLGAPITSCKIDMVLSFNVLDNDGNVLNSYRYTTGKKSALGLYYGKDAKVCVVEATKDIIAKFKQDINNNATDIIAKLEQNYMESPIYYANGQVPMPAKKPAVTKSDVDQNIPQSNKKSEDTYALIIANEEYQFVDNVNFAAHDGEVFKEYCIKTLGIPERQIRYCANASYGVISGGVDWLKYALNNFEGSKAIVYYCGHGIPDEKTGDAYIIPVDGKGTNTTTCYSLNTLYTTLANTKASNITYFMDACFTGANKEGSMLVAARGVAREAKKETLQGNSVVFSASSGDETAMTHPEKGHGLFTYFLLKKLQETGGNVSYSELANYINKNVKKEAFLINEKPQTPVVATSPSATQSWGNMTLK